MCTRKQAAKFKTYAVLAGVNEPRKSCHGARKARAEVAAYAVIFNADCGLVVRSEGGRIYCDINGLPRSATA